MEEKRGEKYLFQLVLEKMKKYNKSLKTLVDILALYIISQKEILSVADNSMCLKDFKKFLE